MIRECLECALGNDRMAGTQELRVAGNRPALNETFDRGVKFILTLGFSTNGIGDAMAD